jgi:hypothetical protein
LIDTFITHLRDEMDKLLNAIESNIGGGGSPSSSSVDSKKGKKGVEDTGSKKDRNTYVVYNDAEKRVLPKTPIIRAVAEGGLITGGTPGRDSVPLMSMPGEFMLNKRAVDAIGISTLNSLNAGTKGGLGDMSFSMPITVMGNLDKSVLPDIEKVVDKMFDRMNSTLHNRGYKRTTNVYST